MNRKILFLLLACVIAGCAEKTAESAGEVAFYLPAQTLSGHEILAADLESLELDEEPLIAADEIISYTLASHDLELKPEALERLAALEHTPVNGIGFVVCVDKTPIFVGAVVPLYSSISFKGVTIQIPLEDADSTLVHLYSGYPSKDDPLPDDPREDERMLHAFEQAGKLH